MTARKFVVHGLPPMTTAELGAIRCGHRHQLTCHVTGSKGVTQCGICHCVRSPAEDIREPHDFSGETA